MHQGGRTVIFDADDPDAAIESAGAAPLPPYIHTDLRDPERYQTTYATGDPDSAAAPTAGLHFTARMIDRLRDARIGWSTLRLDVGLATFAPIRTERVEDHPMHEERYALPATTVEAIGHAQRHGGRVVAVGTTVVRVLETCASGRYASGRERDTRLFIHPGHRFHAVDGLLTNFHQPRSSLLVLLAAFIGDDRWRSAYAHALGAGYRFLSLGDCMLCWGEPGDGRASRPKPSTVTRVPARSRPRTVRCAHRHSCPSGRHATVKALHPDEVRAAGVDILLCNAYHLALRPGLDLIERAGGLHAFMGWEHPILTDSGGFQLVSLAEVATVDDRGATFVSPYDGSQAASEPGGGGAQPGPPRCRRPHVPRPPRRARHRSRRRARGHRAHPSLGGALPGSTPGWWPAALRHRTGRFRQGRAGANRRGSSSGLDFDGVAIGGLSVGEPRGDDARHDRGERGRASRRPRPRYFMGLGTDAELLAAIALGVDMFDCVVPTRLARNGSALTPDGRLSLRNAAARDEFGPIDPACPCAACRGFSRAYLRHLFQAGEILAHRLVSLHNITHLARLMDGARTAIREERFAAFQADRDGRLRSAPR